MSAALLLTAKALPVAPIHPDGIAVLIPVKLLLLPILNEISH